jgi:hypothetical protein
MLYNKIFFVLLLFPVIIFSGQLERNTNNQELNFLYLSYDVKNIIFKECDTDPNTLCALRTVDRACNNKVLDFCSYCDVEHFLEKYSYIYKAIFPKTFRERVFSYWLMVKMINDDERIKDVVPFFAVENFNIGTTVEDKFVSRLNAIHPDFMSDNEYKNLLLTESCIIFDDEKAQKIGVLPYFDQLFFLRHYLECLEMGDVKLIDLSIKRIKKLRDLFERESYCSNDDRKEVEVLLNLLFICARAIENRSLNICANYITTLNYLVCIGLKLVDSENIVENSIEAKILDFIVKVLAESDVPTLLERMVSKLISNKGVNSVEGARFVEFAIAALAQKDHFYNLTRIAFTLIDNQSVNLKNSLGENHIEFIAKVLTENKKYSYLKRIAERMVIRSANGLDSISTHKIRNFVAAVFNENVKK